MKDIKLDTKFKCFIYGLGMSPFGLFTLFSQENPMNLMGLILKEKDQKFMWVFGCVLFSILIILGIYLGLAYLG
ncbi:hypothetical protein HYT57_01580 [Candidatus Woesearchaeota archaeon]|nr:hypothetical protein [Candidatus Woesearchaeota archaeon]